jgi:hypothetical protein
VLLGPLLELLASLEDQTREKTALDSHQRMGAEVLLLNFWLILFDKVNILLILFLTLLHEVFSDLLRQVEDLLRELILKVHDVRFVR